MADGASATSRLGAFVTRTTGAKLSAAIASKAAIWMPPGLAIAARDENIAAAARAMTTPVGNVPGIAPLWVDGARAVLSEAVLANGASALMRHGPRFWLRRCSPAQPVRGAFANPHSD